MARGTTPRHLGGPRRQATNRPRALGKPRQGRVAPVFPRMTVGQFESLWGRKSTARCPGSMFRVDGIQRRGAWSPAEARAIGEIGRDSGRLVTGKADLPRVRCGQGKVRGDPVGQGLVRGTEDS